MITNKNYNVDLACLSDKKSMYNFAKEMNFDVRVVGNRFTRDRTRIKFLRSPGLKLSAPGLSIKIFLPSNFGELCDRIKLILQEKLAANNSDLINREIFAIPNKLLECKCISKKQHIIILINCSLFKQ